MLVKSRVKNRMFVCVSYFGQSTFKWVVHRRYMMNSPLNARRKNRLCVNREFPIAHKFDLSIRTQNVISHRIPSPKKEGTIYFGNIFLSLLPPLSIPRQLGMTTVCTSYTFSQADRILSLWLIPRNNRESWPKWLTSTILIHLKEAAIPLKDSMTDR